MRLTKYMKRVIFHKIMNSTTILYLFVLLSLCMNMLYQISIDCYTDNVLVNCQGYTHVNNNGLDDKDIDLQK